MENNKRILFLLVNYNNDEEVKNFIRQELFTQSFSGIEISIINNASQDAAGLNAFAATDKRLTYLKPGKNLGYLGAAHYAYTDYVSRNAVPDFVILCNTDIEIKDKDFLKKLSTLSLPADLGVIGPSVISTVNQQDTNPYLVKRESRSHLQRLNRMYNFYPIYMVYEYSAHLKNLLVTKPQPPKNRQPVYGVHGSFIIFTKHYFQSGANLQYNAFLYGEEIFIAEQVRKFYLTTVYEPTLQVFHYEHSTTGLIKTREHVKRMQQSVQVLLNDFFHE